MQDITRKVVRPSDSEEHVKFRSIQADEYSQILYALETHIGVFMEIFMHESARRIGDQNVLRKVDALMDWSLVLPLLKTV